MIHKLVYVIQRMLTGPALGKESDVVGVTASYIISTGPDHDNTETHH